MRKTFGDGDLPSVFWDIFQRQGKGFVPIKNLPHEFTLTTSWRFPRFRLKQTQLQRIKSQRAQQFVFEALFRSKAVEILPTNKPTSGWWALPTPMQ